MVEVVEGADPGRAEARVLGPGVRFRPLPVLRVVRPFAKFGSSTAGPGCMCLAVGAQRGGFGADGAETGTAVITG